MREAQRGRRTGKNCNFPASADATREHAQQRLNMRGF
jgi:hypothetical protein